MSDGMACPCISLPPLPCATQLWCIVEISEPRLPPPPESALPRFAVYLPAHKMKEVVAMRKQTLAAQAEKRNAKLTELALLSGGSVPLPQPSLFIPEVRRSVLGVGAKTKEEGAGQGRT